MPITAWWRIPAYCPQTHAHSISVLLNLKVNGNPTQYQMLLTGLYLTAGHSYNYTATVKISNGVTVLTWQNRSWTENVVMDK